MSAVWTVSRAAVRRRRLQTLVIGVVVALSTTMIVVALGLLAASTGPFDQAYSRQSGAHLVASYDRTKVSDSRLTAAARTAEASAGPFGIATLDLNVGGPPLSLVVVGRGDAGGPVDRLNVWEGRWPDKPGEIVLNRNPVTSSRGRGAPAVGNQLTVPGGPTLTVVGFAYSVSESADAWVTPAQMTALKPTASQMLYRFTQSATNAQVAAGESAVTAGLPSGALLGTQSYLVLRAVATGEPNTFVPFLLVFGWLGLAVAVLIVANVVSGAVVAGFRHIGVLKALGFTPTQVMAVYLAMISIPAIVGCALGVVLGNVLAESLLTRAFENYGAEGVGVPVWVDVAALVGVPLLVALSALVPSLRARSLSAAEAISAGSAPRAGRGLRAQRWLSGTRLPRSVSLGLGLPFARPARTALTLAAVVLGVTSVTLAVGLGESLTTYQTAASRAGAVDLTMFGGRAENGSRLVPEGVSPAGPVAKLSDSADEALLRSSEGALSVTASHDLPMRLAGTKQDLRVTFYRGDSNQLGYRVLEGRWPDGPGQVAVSERFLRQRGVAVGDTIALQSGGKSTQVRIVAKVLYNSGEEVLSNWDTLALVAPGTEATTYEVQLKPGTDIDAYVKAVQAGDSGLEEVPGQDPGPFIAIVLATVILLTLMLGTVAALGVFNTVVLNTRERRRDLGMLKSIGMTPAQVTLMVVTSMAALGAVGGLLGIPIGIIAHRLVVPAMANGAQVEIPDFMLDVYPLGLLALLVLAGIAIAALGAFLPARSAARATIAEVLHNE